MNEREGDGGEQVRSLLRDAAATFESLGLQRPADGCRALLRDTGVAVPRRVSAQAGVPERLRAFGVTARELEVLRLVADGAVTAVDGSDVPVQAESACVHGDSPGAVEMARAVRAGLADAGVGLRAFA